MPGINPLGVDILVRPSAADTTPPAITWTWPASDATGVAFGATPILTDTLGPAYTPFPILAFTEALGPATVTASNLRLTGPNNTQIPIGIAYDEQTRQVSVSPRAELVGNTWCTVTAAVAITDLAGNHLAGPVTWSFKTAAPPRRYTYLPLLRKQ